MPAGTVDGETLEKLECLTPICLSLTYKKAKLDSLEKLFVKDPVGYAAELKGLVGCNEVLVLQTCNRFEIYLDSIREEKLKELLEILKSKLPPQKAESIEVYFGVEAVRHIFRIASGLESMIIGETQVLGQVRDAYLQHLSARLIGEGLRLVFERAIKTGKRVRSETKISCGAVSIASAAVELVEDILKNVSGKSFLILGAGTMAKELVFILSKIGVRKLKILNRTVEKAKTLAEKYGYEWGSLRELSSELRRVDVMFSAVSVDKPIVAFEIVEEALPYRDGKPLLIVDISTPRSVELKVSKLKSVTLKDIDDLRSVARKNMVKRIKEIPRAEEIIEEELSRYLEIYNSKLLDKAIARMYLYAEKIRKKELEKAARKLRSEESSRVLEDMTKSMVKKVLHPIVSGIRRVAREDYVKTYNFIFKILTEGLDEV